MNFFGMNIDRLSGMTEEGMNKFMSENLLVPTQAAAYLGLTYTAFIYRLKAGQIKHDFRINNVHIFYKWKLDEWKEANPGYNVDRRKKR